MQQKAYPWLVLVLMSIGVLLQSMNFGTLNVSLPELRAAFHTGPVLTSWIVLSYMLFNTIFILFFGKIGDINGRRRLYLFGLAEFTLASLLCGFAPNAWLLIVLRILQGIGGAIIITNTTAFLIDAFPKNRLVIALNTNMIVVTMAQLIGPVIGGVFVMTLGWRWVFWFNVPLGIIAFIGGVILLRPVHGIAKMSSVDIWGNTTLFLSLGGLILMLSEIGVDGWKSPLMVLGALMFLFFLGLFLLVERRCATPMLDLHLFKDQPYTMANLAAFFNSLGRSSIILLISLFFRVVDHENALTAGLKVLPLTIGLLAGIPLIGYLTRHVRARVLALSGLILTCIGIGILMSYIGPHASIFWISTGQFLIGFGTTIFQVPNARVIMSRVEPQQEALANSIRATLQNMGQVISTALCLTLVSGILPDRLKNLIYGGVHHKAHLYAQGLHLISDGYRITFGVLLILTVIGMLATFIRHPVKV